MKESEILSDALFEELFSIRDVYDRERKHQEVQDKARELKLLSKFNKLYNAYCASNKKMLAVADQQTYITDFEGQEPLRSGVWKADMDGIWTMTALGKAYACSHPIFPRGILLNIETKTCKVELVFWVRGRWQSVFVDRKVIASRNTIVSLASNGVRVTSENAGLLVKYLSDIEALNEDAIKEVLSTSRLGWITPEVFLPYDSQVVFDNENNVGTIFNSIRVNGYYSKWLDCVLNERKNKRMEVLVSLAASFASVLVEPMGVLPFIVDLWGGTGKGKTVTLKLATSVWANPAEGEYITDAKSTANAMEIRLDVLNSLPMTIDDLTQIKNSNNMDFGLLIYHLCSGSGKGRATKDAGLKQTYSWKNIIITTAEHSLVSETSQGGAINRVIDIECGNTDIYESGHDVCEILHENYGYAGKKFVEAIKNMGIPELQKKQKEYCDMLLAYAKETGHEKEDKQIIPMSIILMADEISEREIFKDNIRLDPKACFDLLRDKNDVSEGIRAYRYLMDTIVANDFRFDDSDDDFRQERWGKHIGPHKIAIIGKNFDNIIKEAGSQSKAFLSWADSVGIIEKDKDGNPKKVVNYGKSKQSTRSVVIRTDWGTEEDPPEEVAAEFYQSEIPFD